MIKIDKKITPKELAEKGLMVDGIEILPPIPEKTQNQKRAKRELVFYKLFGRIYYQTSDLMDFVEKSKINVVA